MYTTFGLDAAQNCSRRCCFTQWQQRGKADLVTGRAESRLPPACQRLSALRTDAQPSGICEKRVSCPLSCCWIQSVQRLAKPFQSCRRLPVLVISHALGGPRV